jgi:amino acid adenylation domain-containing protein
MVEHRGMLNHLAAKIEQLELTAADRVAQSDSQCFDVSIWQFLAPLLVGGRVEIVRGETAHDPVRLLAAVEQAGVTIFQTVPSVLRHWLDEMERGDVEAPRLGSLRWLIATGEALAPEIVRQWFAHYPRIPLLNGYGATECSDDISHQVLRRPPAGSRWQVPIGRPVRNSRLHVLGPGLEPLPLGVPGQVYIGGHGVGRGYLGEAAQTAAVFVPDPWCEQPGGRLYATGDRGLHLADGALCFLGRFDQQLKLYGWRIEPGEIEAALLRHPAVGQAVVAAAAGPAAGVRLVAWWVAAAGAEVSAAELRRFLGGLLPQAMLPAVYLRLDALPRLPSGKIDRRRLPPPTGTEAEAGAAAAGGRPPTLTEELVGQIWGDLLARERIGIEDDFFALGGHSLLATRVISRVRATFGVELPLQALFQAPALGAFAAQVAAAQRDPGAAAPPPIRRVSRGGELPLSFAQERLWFIDQLLPGSALYNVPLRVELRGRLEVRALAASLAQVVGRHEVLRTRFAVREGRPCQVIAAPGSGAGLAVVELGGLPAGRRDEAAGGLAMAAAVRPFDLEHGPLLRAALVRLEAERSMALLTLHHIIADGWSLGVLVQEVGELYGAWVGGRRPVLPELAVQYADYAAWQRQWLSGEVLATELAWWRERLAGAPEVLDLPTDRPRPALPKGRGAQHRSELPRELVGALRALARGRGTLFMPLLAGFQALLCRFTGQHDLVVGTAVANRNRLEVEGLIGFFVNTLALRSRLDGEASFAELFAQARETALGAFAHQDLPFEKLVEELRPQRSLAHAPLLQVMLVLQNAPGATLDIPGLTLAPADAVWSGAKFDLTLQLSETTNGIAAFWEYDPDLFDAATVLRLARALQVLLGAAAAQPHLRLAALPLLGAGERHQVLHEWAAGAADGGPAGEDGARDDEALVHDLIAAQAARAPAAVAVAGPGGEVLTYGALAARSRWLARRLRARGVGPETVVAIRMRSGPGALVAILAVLEAGGAYLPLDPGYPEERLAFIAADAGVRLVLDDESQAAAGAPLATAEPAPETAAAAPAAEPGRASTRPLPGNPAYAIYTSGSAGQPKGVVVSHGALLRSTRARLAGYGGQVSAFLLLPSLAFDSSVAVIFWTLCQGGCLVIPEDQRRSDPVHLSQLIAEHGISHWLSIPRLYDLLLAHHDPRELASLRTVIVAGEPCPRQLVARHHALLPGAALYDEYGPTECTVWTTVSGPAHAPAGAGTGASIGRPIPGVRVRLLDHALAPAPAGVAAELMIGGEGVARGYLGRPDLTALRFVPDPFAGSAAPPGARLYRSGDLARWLPDGRLDYLGRTDGQLKVHGYRIELGEIEAVLARQPGVREAVVLASPAQPAAGDGQPGAPDLPAIAAAPADLRLVAYVVPAEPTAAPAAQELRDLLRRALPEYMVPAAFVFLATLPVTANGKLDRRALAGLDPGRPRRERRLALPQTEAERRIAAVWQEALGIDEVGVDDNFFALGGHSLLLARVLADLRRQPGGEGLQLVDLFRFGTVAALARHLRQQAGGAPPAAETDGMGADAGEPERLRQGRRRQQAMRDLRRRAVGE